MNRFSHALVQRKGESHENDCFDFCTAFTGPAFAGDVTAAKTAADCAKAGGAWNATTNMCEEKKM